MSPLEFRLPGAHRPLGAWLAQLFPAGDRSLRREWISRGAVRVEGRVADRLDVVPPSGARVTLAVDPADAPGLDGSFTSRSRASTWFAWVDAPSFPRGTLRLSDSGETTPQADAERCGPVDFEVTDRVRGLARVVLQTSSDRPATGSVLAGALARAAMPVVGDLGRGGLAGFGALQLSTDASALIARSDWEDGPAPWPEEADAPLRLRISDEVVKALERGHPWIRPDHASDSASRFRPGTRVEVEDLRGEVHGVAWTEEEGPISARLDVRAGPPGQAAPSIESRVARALASRYPLLFGGGAAAVSQRDPDATDCCRLIHGEADGFPGLFVDRIGPLLRVLVTSRASDGFRDRAIDALLEQLPVSPSGEPWCVLEVLHLRARGGEFERVAWRRGSRAALANTNFESFDDGFWVRERGLRFAVDPGWATPRKVRPGFGLFPDQRENRARLARSAARGGRWLNLFAHTGAFSVSLLADGARSVTSVDLSAAYLSRLEANLDANRALGVDPARHTSVRSEGRRYVSQLPATDRFDGIVLDPPSAAAAGRRFWSVKQDLEPLLGACMDRLEDAGVLLVTQNLAGPPLGLEQILSRLADERRRELGRIEAAPPSADFPARSGFPEGSPFEGALMRLGSD